MIIQHKGKNLLFFSSAIFVITLLCLNGLLTPLISPQSDEEVDTSIINLKSSDYWDLNYTNIHVDGNWSATVAEYSWVSGSGTWGDPYLIENVTIDGQDANSTIIISNTNDYFKINNCTLFDSPTSGINGGIILINVTNGLIIDCEIYSGQYGVYFNETHNVTLRESVIRNNAHYGVYLNYSCQNNTIYENYVGYNLGYQREEIVYKGTPNEQLVNKCYYIIDEYFLSEGNSRNNITNNDEVGSCQASPIYGTLDPLPASYDWILYVVAGVALLVLCRYGSKRYKTYDERQKKILARTDEEVEKLKS